MKVLIVDDDPKFRIILSQKMEEEGFLVVFAANGATALERFRQNPPDAVLLDLDLPDMNGLEVLIQMRQINEQIPIIVVTADEKISTAVRLVKAGAYDYILKDGIEDLGPIVTSAVKIGHSPDIYHERVQAAESNPYAKVHRAHKRIPYQAEVLVDAKYTGKMINLSESGTYIHTGRSHKLGSSIQLSFPIGGRQVSLSGTIRQSQHGIGVGVQFADPRPATIANIKRFIEGRAGKVVTEKDTTQWVLMISEDSSALRIYKSHLILTGLSILEANSLSKAGQYLSRKKIRAVLLDVDMPGVDAPKVIRKIKSTSYLKNVPVIAFYATYQRSFDDDIMKTGVDFHATRTTTTPKRLAQFLLKE